MDIREFVKNQEENAIMHPWESARIEVIYKLIKEQSPTESPKVIVDIGCGDAKITGSLAERMEKTDFLGIDTALDDELIEKISGDINLPNLKLISSQLDITGTYSKADFVMILDVLEHIENDSDFFTKLSHSSSVKKGTNFLITVPAFQSLFVSRDIWLGHYRRYTTNMIKKYARENNLEIVKFGYFFSILVPIRFLQKLIENKNAKKDYEGISNWNGNKIVAKILKNLLILDFQIVNLFNKIGIRFPGLSCYLICKKQ